MPIVEPSGASGGGGSPAIEVIPLAWNTPDFVNPAGDDLAVTDIEVGTVFDFWIIPTSDWDGLDVDGDEIQVAADAGIVFSFIPFQLVNYSSSDSFVKALNRTSGGVGPLPPPLRCHVASPLRVAIFTSNPPTQGTLNVYVRRYT